MKKVQIKQNLIDKVYGYFSPEKAVRRMRAKVAMSLFNSGFGGYAGASKSRRSMSGWSVTSNDADADILPDLPTLRERSRDLIRNNPMAAGAINTKVGNVVGTGLRLNSQIDADFLGMEQEQAEQWEANTEREFRLWAESPDCDATRTLNFYGLQELAFRSTLENGDVFVLLPDIKRLNRPYSLSVQLIEGDRVCNENYAADNEKVAGGVERDDAGAPVGYWVATRHPGSKTHPYNAKWKRYPAYGAQSGRRNMLHLYRKLRIGQTRGVPDLAPVIEPLRQLGDYTDAELAAAVVASYFTVFIKAESGLGPMEPTTETGGKTSDKDFKMGPAALLELMPGETVETANPGRPNQAFDPFVQAILRQIGVALELPFEILIGHFTASYSAARAAMLQAWKFFRARRQWLAAYFCQIIYEEWLTEAVSVGRISAPGFFRDPAVRAAYSGAEWIGPAQGQIDPKKENDADAIAEDRGWKTAAENTAEKTGGDWNRKHQQRAREVKKRREAGLESPQGAANAAPSRSETETEDNDDTESREI